MAHDPEQPEKHITPDHDPYEVDYDELDMTDGEAGNADADDPDAQIVPLKPQHQLDQGDAPQDHDTFPETGYVSISDQVAGDRPTTTNEISSTQIRTAKDETSAAQPKSAVTDKLRTETHAQMRDVDAVLQIDHFNLWYGTYQALHDIDMAVPRGQVTALVGPSGCGKSTLLRSVNRINDLISTVRIEGQMRLNGDPIYDRSIDVIELRKRMGMVFQKPNPFPMGIYENVAYPLRIDGVRDRRVLDEVCERSLRGAALWDEVKDRLADNALSLSGGQQQRLCIARAIAAEPEVLLMDEPCSALDPIATGKIEDLMQDLRGSYTILIVTHNMQQASRTSEFCAFMYLGRLVEYGPTSELFTNPHLKQTEDYITGRFG